MEQQPDATHHSLKEYVKLVPSNGPFGDRRERWVDLIVRGRLMTFKEFKAINGLEDDKVDMTFIVRLKGRGVYIRRVKTKTA